MPGFHYTLATLFLAACSFALGGVYASGDHGLRSAIVTRVTGMAATGVLGVIAGAATDATSISLAMSLPAFGYAPFALGSVLFAEKRRLTLLMAVVDVVALAGVTVIGAQVDWGGDVLVHPAPVTVIASVMLLAAYVGGTVYAGTVSNCRPFVPLACGVVAWVVFALALGNQTVGARALALSPLLLLAATMELFAEPTEARSGASV